MKYKIKKKFQEYKEHEGTTHYEPSMTDQSQAEDADIYSCIEKYGMQSLMNKTQAQEFLYLDNTGRDMTLDEAVRQRQQLNEYFEGLPARVRKTFGDSADMFIEKYHNGKFDDFLSTGVLSQEMVNEMTADLTIERENTDVKVEENIASIESIPTDNN